MDLQENIHSYPNSHFMTLTALLASTVHVSYYPVVRLRVVVAQELVEVGGRYPGISTLFHRRTDAMWSLGWPICPTPMAEELDDDHRGHKTTVSNVPTTI